jgi:hypothetical protein
MNNFTTKYQSYNLKNFTEMAPVYGNHQSIIFHKRGGVAGGLSGDNPGIMSAGPGKVHILGVNKINGEKVFSLRFVQAGETKHVNTPFFTRYNSDAIWLDDLKPWKSDKFFFE